MKNTTELKKLVQERPITAVAGAVLVGFAFGSGVALPLLAGAGMNRSGLEVLVKSWLAREVQQGLRDYLRPQHAAAAWAAEPGVEDHDHSDSGAPGGSPLARQVRRELGY